MRQLKRMLRHAEKKSPDNRSRFILKLLQNSAFRDFHSLKDIIKPEYRHALLMLFWLIDFPSYFLIQLFVKDYSIVHCALDDLIPFREWFSIFYVLWFPYFMGTLLYTMLYDPPAFKRGMYSFMLIFTITKFIFLFLPNGVNLRPDPMPRNNIFTKLVLFLYGKDRSMNCCPSEHALGALIALMMAFDSKKLSNPGVRAAYTFMAVMICLSILYIKQHSVLDIAAAIPLLFLAWTLFYRKKAEGAKQEDGEAADMQKNRKAAEIQKNRKIADIQKKRNTAADTDREERNVKTEEEPCLS